MCEVAAYSRTLPSEDIISSSQGNYWSTSWEAGTLADSSRGSPTSPWRMSPNPVAIANRGKKAPQEGCSRKPIEIDVHTDLSIWESSISRPVGVCRGDAVVGSVIRIGRSLVEAPGLRMPEDQRQRGPTLSVASSSSCRLSRFAGLGRIPWNQEATQSGHASPRPQHLNRGGFLP
jgi:hypothetical protein